MASLPPRPSSFSTSPHLGTPDTGNSNINIKMNSRSKALALVPITTKDASPANSGGYGRSPLSSLGTNTSLGLGIRQRQAHPPSPFFNNMDAIKGPPRASMTVNMGGGSHGSGGMGLASASRPQLSVNNDMTTTQPTPFDMGGWIHVWGFSSQSQRGEVLRKFRSMGTVTHIKIASKNQNWVALKYDDNLEVEKAASEKCFQLDDGTFCGVRKLQNEQLFFQQQQQHYSPVVSPRGPNDDDNDNNLLQLFLRKDKSTPHTDDDNVAEINEADILLGNSTKPANRRKSCCEAVFSWIYGWD